jgi:hypothetical protein
MSSDTVPAARRGRAPSSRSSQGGRVGKRQRTMPVAARGACEQVWRVQAGTQLGWGGLTPPIPYDHIRELGFALVLFPIGVTVFSGLLSNDAQPGS